MDKIEFPEILFYSFLKDIQKYAIDVKLYDDEVIGVSGKAEDEFKKILQQQKGIMRYSYIRKFTREFHLFAQDYLTMYSYDKDAFIIFINSLFPYMNRYIDCQKHTVHGRVIFNSWMESNVAYLARHIEQKLHWSLMQNLTSVAGAPTYPGPGVYTNVSNTFTLAMFLYDLLDKNFIVGRKGECNILVFYPRNVYNAMGAIHSPITLMPIAEQYRSYIAKEMPNLRILPHDINDGEVLPKSYLAINTCGVFPFISDVTIKEVNSETIEYSFDLALIYFKDEFIFSDTVENGLKNI